MLFKEIIDVYSENYTKHKYALRAKCRSVNAKLSGTCSYQPALNNEERAKCRIQVMPV
jgi:hypothetical protein